jgi:3-methylfumaryl-CoA hydratase
MTASLEDLKQHIGASETAEDVVTASQVGRLAAALDIDHPAPRHGDPIPPGWHGAFCPALVKLSMLRADGQPAGGGIVPPVPLPRHTLDGVDARFDDAIRIGDRLQKVTEIADVVVDGSETNPSVRLTIRETISSPRGIAVVEERRSAYFGSRGPATKPDRPEIPGHPAWNRTYPSDAAMMFRLSAVRYNTHRIHYDRDYSTKVEGLPGLVVPLSLVSMLMLEQCRAHTPGRSIEAFRYRSIRRVFDLGPFTVCGRLDGDKASLWATDSEGELAVVAEVGFTE